MRIGLILQDYRQKKAISMDYFAKQSGLSKAYIGLLEKGIHPKTRKPITPSVDTIKKVAKGMNMEFEELFNMLDEDVSLSDNIDKEPAEADPFVEKIQLLLENATPEQKDQLLKVAEALLDK